MQTTIHTLESLRKIIRRLQKENEKLRLCLEENGIEISETISQDILDEEDKFDEDQGARIVPIKPNIYMAKQFYGMFWGREDVYARRGKNGGYFPQCKNRWDSAICPKQQGESKFCDEDCVGRVWKPLDEKIILNHLLGKEEDCTDVIGTYPLLPDGTCRFLVFDFDNHEKDSYKNDDANIDNEWKTEVDSLRKICKINNIDALVERSRSGRGAHVWIFFKEAISAALARNFGLVLLNKGAMEVNLTSFKFYDRMYPSQDVLSKLGNLVALPLQGQALKEGNSAFVDEDWNAYNDQWQTLMQTQKVSKYEVETLLKEWQIFYESNNAVINQNLIYSPWKSDEKFKKEYVVDGTIHLKLSDGLYVDTLNLKPAIQNIIRRMATIDNPEYYKNQRIGRSNYYNFKTIYLGYDTDGYIRIPRGLREKIILKCNEADISYDIEDNRQFGRPIRVEFNGELRDEQKEAINNLLEKDDGILSAAPAFGKTVVSAYIISRKKVSTLILIESASLLQQWLDELNRFLKIDEKPPVYYTKTGREKIRESVIGTLVGGQDKTTGIIDVAMVGSAYKKGDFFPKIEEYGLVIMDECHHAASKQAQAVLNRIKSKYVYGVSATPQRSDRLEQINYMLLGPIRHEYSSKMQADEQGTDRYVYPRFTRVVNISGKELSIHEADDLIVNNLDRTSMIVNDVKECIADGRTPVILVKLKKHVKLLSDALTGIADHVFLLYGDQSIKENQSIQKQLMETPENESFVVIATGQKIGEGFNCPRLDTLMLASPVKFEGRLIQYVGRLCRKYPGKENVIVYDYVDSHIKFFYRQYRSRLSTYKKLGYSVISNVKPKSESINMIFDGKDFSETFERDLVEANNEIVISSPHIIERKIDRVIELLKARQEAGVSVTIITLKPEEIGFGDTINVFRMHDSIRRAGFYLKTSEIVEEHFAVIDNEVVWHGSMDLLGKSDVSDNIIRVESKQAAAELLEMMD